MLIRVRFKDGRIDLVPSRKLDELIVMSEIEQFERSAAGSLLVRTRSAAPCEDTIQDLSVEKIVRFRMITVDNISPFLNVD